MVGAFSVHGSDKQIFGADKQVSRGGQSDKAADGRVQQQEPILTKIIVTLTAALVIALPSIANAECGTRGGPGLRGPDGKCQSWDRVQSVCGADGSRCQRERVSPLLPKIDTVPAHKLMECAHGMRNDC
jgi:hypothetical protein